MSTPADDPTAATQIGAILASAEQQVKEILTAAQRDADDTHAQARQALDERAAELTTIAQALAVSAQLAQQQLLRLQQLEPLRVEPDEIPDGAPASWGAPAPGDAPPREPRPQPTAEAPAAAPEAAGAPVPPSPFTPSGNQWVTTPDDELPIVGSSEPEEAPGETSDRLDSARLVALSMAASGRSREEVEAHVRDELGITDPAPLIDYVFGISTPSSVVPSWPPRRSRRASH